MKKIFGNLFILLLVSSMSLKAQEVNSILAAVKTKMSKVTQYEATGEMKTKVVFLKLPVATVKLYYKKPDKFKLKSEKGISFMPKGSVNFNLNTLFNDDEYTAIDAGSEKIDNIQTRVIKLLPIDDNSDWVLSTFYIDPANSLILKSKTTTKENGTYELKMKYGTYADFGLPDEISFLFNTKDYKLPKGVTFDFDDRSGQPASSKNNQPKKGEVNIKLSKYQINKSIPESIFK